MSCGGIVEESTKTKQSYMDLISILEVIHLSSVDLLLEWIARHYVNKGFVYLGCISRDIKPSICVSLHMFTFAFALTSIYWRDWNDSQHLKKTKKRFLFLYTFYILCSTESSITNLYIYTSLSCAVGLQTALEIPTWKIQTWGIGLRLLKTIIIISPTLDSHLLAFDLVSQKQDGELT